MAPRKSHRWLPENVTAYKDRHGKTRYRLRKTGLPTYHFKAEPGTPEFMEELLEARGGPPAAQRGVIPFSMDDLAQRLYRSPRWMGMQDSSQYTYRRIIDRYLERTDKNGRRYGTYPAKKATVTGIETHVAELAATPASANNLLKALKRMFAYAIKLQWMTFNPAAHADGFKAGPGWHTWTDKEIERFRAHWANGTMARLTFELALNTAARRCNLAELERSHLAYGRWEIAHAKKGDETSVPITQEAQAAIDALPAAPIRFFITSATGKPYTVESLGNRFRKWAKDADCPTQLHGIRKGVSRQLAESGATDAEGQSITGQKKSKTFAHYRAKADRRRLADNAMAKMIGEPDLANPDKN